MTSVPNSHIPRTAAALVQTVNRFGMATASQLRRLHYEGTERGVTVRSNYHLRRLVAFGLLRRLWGVYGSGAPQFVYFPPPSPGRAGPRAANQHTLDITELYVRLVDRGDRDAKFMPEPWCHEKIGGYFLKPDAYIELGEHQFFIEMDLDSEHPARIREKLTGFINVRRSHEWKEENFPMVLWVCHTPERRADLERIIKRCAMPDLFRVILFDEVIRRLPRS